jgi:hypothetical protein
VYGAGLPIEQTSRRRGVLISGIERGIEVIVTSSSFAGCGEDFRCFRLVLEGLMVRLRDWRFASRISSVGDDMICGDLREAEKYNNIVIEVMKRNKIKEKL